MQSLVLAANGADAAAVDAIARQHTEFTSTMAIKTIHLSDAARAASAPEVEAARADLAGWCRSSLLPFLRREAEVLYPALRPTSETATLVAGLRRSLADIAEEAERLQGTTSSGDEVARTAVDLRGHLERHLTAENDSLLPYLAFSPHATLAELWRRIDETPLPADPVAHEHSAGAVCRCADEEDGLPALDVRNVPHAIRHATVFGALDAIAPGGGMILIAPHDPLPLLAQIEQRMPGRFTVSYLLRTPEECRVQFQRGRL